MVGSITKDFTRLGHRFDRVQLGQHLPVDLRRARSPLCGCCTLPLLSSVVRDLMKGGASAPPFFWRHQRMTNFMDTSLGSPAVWAQAVPSMPQPCSIYGANGLARAVFVKPTNLDDELARCVFAERAETRAHGPQLGSQSLPGNSV